MDYTGGLGLALSLVGMALVTTSVLRPLGGAKPKGRLGRWRYAIMACVGLVAILVSAMHGMTHHCGPLDPEAMLRPATDF